MEMVLTDLLTRLDQFSNQFNDLRDGIRQAIKIAQDDPEMSLTRARKVLEYIVRDVYESGLKTKAGTQPLENLLQRVVKEGLLPKRLAAYATAVRELGNVGTHSFDDQITHQDVLQSLTSLMPIVEWFFEQKNADDAPVVSDRAPQRAEARTGAEAGTAPARRAAPAVVRRGVWPLAFAAVVLAGLIAGGIAIFSHGKGGATGQNPLVISSLEDENVLAQAVGLVVVPNRVFFPNGSIIEVPRSMGTCFAVSPDGYLLTAGYVVDGATSEKTPQKMEDVDVEVDKPILVYFRKVRFEAKVVYTSKQFNLTILKVDRQKQYPFFALSSNDTVKPRLHVTTLGYSGISMGEGGEQGWYDTTRLEKAVKEAQSKKVTVYAESVLDENRFALTTRSGPVGRVAKNEDGVMVIYHEAKIFQGSGGGPLVEPNGTSFGINTHSLERHGEITYASSATGQFRPELEEFLPEKLVWRE